MNEARGIFEEINDPLAHSLDAVIKLSSIDEKLDNALNILDPIEALKEIENALKNVPEIEGLIEPEKTIFNGTVEFFSEIAISLNSTAEHTENAEAPENPSNDWNSLKTLRTRRSPR